ncbi:restriction endonuclease subunit S [Gluconobacter cerinus]|uniref:restriction endonuclease subunit S n=1 Tax=Gluconobacter cerinus TaxID=38307 RepID=UPI001B8D076B|nr:restriction endonuclease subunit S [Gluconobacter cerinus]MBS1035994.1 restriction endonuclease subunit S [Gluconobacter cerinus]
MTIAVYPKYESYKDGASERLDFPTPSHWQNDKARFLFRFNKGLTITKENLQDEGIPCVNYGEIHARFGFEVDPARDALKCVSPDYLKANAGSLLHRGDFVFADTSEDIEGSGNFTHLASDEPTFAGYHTLIARPNNRAETRYLAYMLNSSSFRKQVQRAVKGVKVFSISQGLLKNLEILLPPLPEQRAIAAFLDGKCATIDEAVRIKEEQIKLLAERRQILIQEAVTSGLNPNAPMKDSGIDWIGQIPAHWEVKRGKHLFREVNERSEDGTEELLSVSHTTGVTARSEKNVNMFLAEDYTGSKLCQPGDIVINTMWAWMGALGVSDLTGIISPSYGVYRALEDGSFNHRFLEWLLRTTPFIEQYNKISTGLHSSRLRLYPHMFLGLFMALPDRVEQDAIVEQVEREAGKIDKAISLKESQITALREYKTSLINAAVTGKIKVL